MIMRRNINERASLSIGDDNDTVDQNTNGELLHLPLIDWQNMSANVTTKPSLSKPTMPMQSQYSLVCKAHVI